MHTDGAPEGGESRPRRVDDTTRVLLYNDGDEGEGGDAGGGGGRRPAQERRDSIAAFLQGRVDLAKSLREWIEPDPADCMRSI